MARGDTTVRRGNVAVKTSQARSAIDFIPKVDGGRSRKVQLLPELLTRDDRTSSTHGLFDFHFSSKIIPIVIPI